VALPLFVTALISKWLFPVIAEKMTIECSRAPGTNSSAVQIWPRFVVSRSFSISSAAISLSWPAEPRARAATWAIDSSSAPPRPSMMIGFSGVHLIALRHQVKSPADITSTFAPKAVALSNYFNFCSGNYFWAHVINVRMSLNVKSAIVVGVVSLLFLWVRLDHLSDRLTVGTDQGIHFLEMYNIVKSQRITLIGPVSSFNANGRQFFFGPATYYFALPVFYLSNWNPLAVSYFLILVQFLAFFICFYAVYRLYDRAVALYFLLLASVTPIVVNYSRFLWNPNLMLVASAILLAVLVIVRKKPQSSIWFFLIGVLFGLGLQFHYAFMLTIILTIVVILYWKIFHVRKFLFCAVGFVVGFLPLVIFELRHGFYNLKTIILFFSYQPEKISLEFPVGYIQDYHFLSLVPYLLLFFAYLFKKFTFANRFLAFVVLLAFLFLSLVSLVPVPAHGFRTSDDWNYKSALEIRDIIRGENLPLYNIVDLLTGDTRAMFVRSMLVTGGHAPLGVTKYSESSYLFIYSKMPIEEILGGDLWEITSVKPVVLLKWWEVKDGIYLYLVGKTGTKQ